MLFAMLFAKQLTSGQDGKRANPGELTSVSDPGERGQPT
ncbi:addiction module toxin RelE [Leclercia sp. LSNIH3]|nr:addiction module toxin RelE [Leclercia sp. LSNIH3]POW69988.1 addiction module toxin RelE [Leclercia sp. LSNIH4]